MTRSTAAIALLALSACTGSDAELELGAQSQPAILDGISAEAFADDWSVSFDALITSLGELQLSDPQRTDRVWDEVPGPWIVDWVDLPEFRPLQTLVGPAGRNDFGFSTLTATDAATVISGADTDIARMIEDGLVHLVRGTATDGTRTITFDWGFSQQIRYTQCENGADGTPGVALRADGITRSYVEFHVDHLFWTRLGTEDAQMRFGAIADADANDDGEVTLDELAQVDVLDAGYETAGIDVPTLDRFIAFSVAQAPHFVNGGLCTARAR